MSNVYQRQILVQFPAGYEAIRYPKLGDGLQLAAAWRAFVILSGNNRKYLIKQIRAVSLPVERMNSQFRPEARKAVLQVQYNLKTCGSRKYI